MAANGSIYIVDDDRTTGKIIELQLNKLGYSVAGLARSGAEALEHIKARQPDLVLMDINLGRGMDGIETANEIQREYGTPVIYVTAYSDDDTLERAKRTLPFGYINKPIRPADLRTAITLALERARRADAADALPAADSAREWRIQFTCDARGQTIRAGEHVGRSLAAAGVAELSEMLPEEHTEHVSNCLQNRRAQFVTGRVGERVLAWEYAPSSKNRFVRVSVTDITDSATIADQNIQQASLSEALDKLSTGVVFLNENLKVFYTNQSARRMLESCAEIRIHDGFLNCRTPGDTAELHRLVLTASGSTFTVEPEPESGRAPLHMLISPMHSHRQNYGQNLPIAIVYVFSTMNDSHRVADVIRSLYHLSRQEARLAARLIVNPDLREAARAMGITYNTARTHLKRVYAKTETNRLSSLVHMIVTGPAGLLIHSSD
jgi:CheY-like chemotaxis protein/DNA-binding CsgD family transcriptional regulator